MDSLWEILPQEILFQVVQNLPLPDIESFAVAFPEHSEFKDSEDFWRAYSLRRRHFKKPSSCTHKQWATQMETLVVSQVVKGSANSAFTVECSDSVFSLRLKLFVGTFACFIGRDIVVLSKDHKRMRDSERAPLVVAWLSDAEAEKFGGHPDKFDYFIEQ